MVAGVAAYSSYEHQWHFAAAGGADPAGAKLWPLSVDGLLLLASIGLLRTGPHASRRTRTVLRAAFGLGIAVSLVANISAAPVLGWQPVLVAGWPPVALLLAVDLLAHCPPLPPDQPSTDPTPPPQHTARRGRHLGDLPSSGRAVGRGIRDDRRLRAIREVLDPQDQLTIPSPHGRVPARGPEFRAVVVICVRTVPPRRIEVLLVGEGAPAMPILVRPHAASRRR
jgi:hypothetical protein